MIEINLLPDNIRQTEGTPPKRFALYITWLVLALIIGFFIGNYHTIKIPEIKNKIEVAKVEIDTLDKQRKEVENTKKEIDSVKQKVAALENLSRSRVRFGRVLDRLCNAVPEGVWFKSCQVMKDPLAPKYPANAPGGQAYKIVMSGYASGADEDDYNRKLAEFLANLSRLFNVQRINPDPGVTVADDYGFSPSLKLRFHEPALSGKKIEKLPLLSPANQALVKLDNPINEAESFSLSMTFELPPVQKF